MINGIDLFSGIGGISYALRDFVRTRLYCEIEPYCQRVLLENMRRGFLHKAGIWEDVRDVPSWLDGEIDIISGGFPCQDISTSGFGAGLEGERSGLFFELLRWVDVFQPRFVFLENVAAIRSRGADRVGKELAERGYDCRWTVNRASDYGAPHHRERWWLLAYSNSIGRKPRSGESIQPESKNAKWALFGDICSETPRTSWEAKPPIPGMDDGLPYRVDRIKGLGNAVVPEQARQAFLDLITMRKSG